MELTHIGSYRLVKPLGQGAFGIVYQAYQPFLDRYVAIKTLHANDTPDDSQGEQQFMREARTIARLRHNNILSVYEFGTTPIDDVPVTYMVMEYLAGETLFNRLRRERIPLADTIAILEKLANALDYAHARAIIHRDLKPANIMFNENGEPVIVDFGLAKLLAKPQNDGALNLSQPAESSTVGTPLYMSPEQLTGQPISGAADAYALAVIAFEMLTGQSPFETNDMSKMIMERVEGVHRALDEVAPEYGTDAALVFDRALERDPQDRYPDTQTFIRELGDALLPDRHRAQIITVIDPIQAAQLRAARHSIQSIMWTTLLYVGGVMLALITLIANGYQAGSPVGFAWDGIAVPLMQEADGWRTVSGVWAGSPAARAGVLQGDRIKGDLLREVGRLDGLYTINGKPRSEYRAGYQPGTGDVIARTIERDGQQQTITYTLEASPYLLLILLITMPVALLYLLCAAWLLRQWGAEPGLQVMFPLYLIATVFMGTSVALDIYPVLNIIPSTMLVAANVHLMYVFPQPARFIEKHKRRLWLLYLPAALPLVNLVAGQMTISGFSAILVMGILSIYIVLYTGLLVFKWMRRDWRDYAGLGWMILGMWVIVISSLLSLFFALGTVTGSVGNVQFLLVFITRGVFGLCAAPLITYGYHRIQTQMGASLPPEDKLRGSQTLDATLSIPASSTQI